MSAKIQLLNQTYANFLKAIDVVPTENGHLYQVPANEETKRMVLVEGLPLALPDENNTKKYDENLVLFHPICENLLLGESPVVKELRALVMDKVHNLILETVQAMLKIGVDNDLVATLTPTQIELLKCTSGCDETSLKNWNAIMRKVESRSSANRVFTLFLKRGVELNDVNYKRASIVSFNLYDELINNDTSVYGVKIRKVDRKIYTAILETIFDNIDKTDNYTVGSNSSTAPYFDSIMKCFSGLLKQLNGITWAFRKPIKEVLGRDLHVKDEFSEELSELSVLKDIIPPLPYNDGDRAAQANRDKLKVKSQPQPAVEPPVPQPPVVESYACNNLQTTPVVAVPPAPPAPPPVQAPVSKHVSQQMPSIEEQLYGTYNATYPAYPAYAGWQGQPAYQQPMGYTPPVGYPPVAPVAAVQPSTPWWVPQPTQRRW